MITPYWTIALAPTRLFSPPSASFSSILYPVAATRDIWVALLSVRILSESFSMTQWRGIALVVGGISLIGR